MPLFRTKLHCELCQMLIQGRTDHSEKPPINETRRPPPVGSFSHRVMSMLARSSSFAFKPLARTGTRFQLRQASTKVRTEPIKQRSGR